MKSLLDTVEPDIRVDAEGYMSYGKNFTMDKAEKYLSLTKVESLVAECRKQERDACVAIVQEAIERNPHNAAIFHCVARDIVRYREQDELRRMAEGEE